MRDTRGLIYSTALHGFILFMLIVGLPSFLDNSLPPEPEAISVEVLPIAPITNVKPEEQSHKVEKVEHEQTAPKPAPETHKVEEAKEEPIPLPVKEKEPPKPKPKPKPQPKPKPKSDPLKSIFQGIEKEAQKEGPRQEKTVTQESKNTSKSTHYDAGAPLSMSEKDAIRQQIESHWNAPVGAKNAANLKVDLHIELAQDGTVTKVDFNGDQGRYNSDSFFRAAVDSAIRAVREASPLKNLVPEKYNVRDGWSSIDLTFDPRDAL